MSHAFIAVAVLVPIALGAFLALGGELRHHLKRVWLEHCEALITTGFVAGVQYATDGTLPTELAGYAPRT